MYNFMKPISLPYRRAHRDLARKWQFTSLGFIPESTPDDKLAIEDSARIIAVYAYDTPYPFCFLYASNTPWRPRKSDRISKCCPRELTEFCSSKHVAFVVLHPNDATMTFGMVLDQVDWRVVPHVVHDWVFSCVKALALKDDRAIDCANQAAHFLELAVMTRSNIIKACNGLIVLGYCAWWLLMQPHALGWIDPHHLGQVRYDKMELLLIEINAMYKGGYLNRKRGHLVALALVGAMCFAAGAYLNAWLIKIVRNLVRYPINHTLYEMFLRSTVVLMLHAREQDIDVRLRIGREMKKVGRVTTRVQASNLVQNWYRRFCLSQVGLESSFMYNEGYWPWGVHPLGGCSPAVNDRGERILRSLARGVRCGGCRSIDRVMRVCAGCHMVHYCRRACQKSHWKRGHHLRCPGRRD